MRLTPVGKIVVLIVVIGVAVGGWKLWSRTGGDWLKTLAPAAKTTPSVTPEKADLPENTSPDTVNPKAAAMTLPGSAPGCTDKPEVRLLGYAWNAQMGLLLSIGGQQSTSGSRMCAHGVNLKFLRQDDNGKMQEALVAFATALKSGQSNPTAGAHFVTIMGDGSAAFLKGLNDALRRLGPEYQAKVADAFGYSRGEDKFMGPAEWKTNPSSCRGGLVAGVLRDGDWNIAQKWLGDNGLRNNPDEKTWDPDALNWVNANDYIDAAQKYVAGYSEDRPVVRNGRRTGETHHVTVQACVTWTPGDVTVAEKKGGVVSIASTREYSSQMPCVLIGINKWMRDNRAIVEGIVQAAAEGGDMVKSNPQALHRAAEISAKCYGEQDAAYWERYYRGAEETDKMGQSIALGGSSTNNLADTLLCFGMVAGSANLYGATYRAFGDIVKQQYPRLVPNYPPLASILDTSYVADVARRIGGRNPIRPPSYPPGKIGTPISRKDWYIHFDSGRATISPQSRDALQKLMRDLLVASGAAVEIHGHTDNQGNPASNKALSEARAFAVAQWLQHRSPVNFPKGRIRVFAHGQDNPIAPNTTEDGRAKNRRVEIVLGTTGR